MTFSLQYTRVGIWWYHKSYQQYFDILLNYKKLEICCYKKKENKIEKLKKGSK